MESVGFELKDEAMLDTLTLDVVRSSKIEGENLNREEVRSSIARRLGMDISGLVPSARNVEGVVEMMIDATQKFDQPLTEERLFDWHAALFPTGRSGMQKIVVGDWRDGKNGPMQVVSGPVGKEKVHFEAPEARLLADEMATFLQWFNGTDHMEPVVKSGLAHLWFVTIHPFADGNGRIARAIADMQLARADQTNQRYYSMSASIEQERHAYYDILEHSQKGSMDVTNWLLWYLDCLERALHSTDDTLSRVLAKARFWDRNAGISLSDRQQKMINALLDDFRGKLTTTKWAKMTKVSQDTALRDIQDLIEKGVLDQAPGGGRSTNYIVRLE